MQSQPQSGSGCSITTWTDTAPLLYDGNAMHLSAAIKVENLRHDGTGMVDKSIIPNMLTKREQPSQKRGTTLEGTRLALSPDTHSMDSMADYSFVDEIEIGETRIVSSIGHEHVHVKLEYNSNDEMSVEPNLMSGTLSSMREDPNIPHTATRTTERLQENQNLPFKCEYCELSFYNTRQLNNHRRNHQLEECPVCKKTTIARYMKEHIALNHPEANALPEKRLYRCDQCEKVFHCKTLLIDHQRNHQTKECPVCKQRIKSRVLTMHMARKHAANERGTTFRCEQCGKTFHSKPQLVDHQRDHVVKKCSVCNVTILARCMKKHMARKHPPDAEDRSFVRSYPCDRCDKSYSSKRSLALHQTNHEQELNAK